MKKIILAAMAALSLSACKAFQIEGTRPDGSKESVSYYDGGTDLKDLLIIRQKNYFGKASYDDSDPMTDIAFRFEGGQKLQAECTRTRESYGRTKCAIYQVYRSSFGLVPEGTTFPAPEM